MYFSHYAMPSHWHYSFIESFRRHSIDISLRSSLWWALEHSEMKKSWSLWHRSIKALPFRLLLLWESFGVSVMSLWLYSYRDWSRHRRLSFWLDSMAHPQRGLPRRGPAKESVKEQEKGRREEGEVEGEGKRNKELRGRGKGTTTMNKTKWQWQQ